MKSNQMSLRVCVAIAKRPERLAPRNDREHATSRPNGRLVPYMYPIDPVSDLCLVDPAG